jgi:hypothetical protein
VGYGTAVIAPERLTGEEVKAMNACHAEAADLLRSRAVKADGSVQLAKRRGGQPTAAEVASLTHGKFGDTLIHDSELSNEFARLLNRGSSLE